MKSILKSKTLLAAAVFSVGGLSANAATLIAGYDKGSSTSQLLTANGGSGSLTFVDTAVTGGNDISFTTAPATPGFVWRVDAGSNWSIGNGVALTGLAIPLWSNGTGPGNTTSSGTFTFTFYSGGANNNWEGTNNLGTSDDSLIGTATATFSGTTVDEYYVNFDTPVAWTSDSSVLIVHAQSTGSIRFKQGLADVPRENLNNGADQATGLSFSLAGTVTPIPEPSAALLGALGVLCLLRRRRA